MAIIQTNDGRLVDVSDNMANEIVRRGGGAVVGPSTGSPPMQNTGGNGGGNNGPQQQNPGFTVNDVLNAVQAWLNGDTQNGISPNEAKRTLQRIGGDPRQVDRMVQASSNFQPGGVDAGGVVQTNPNPDIAMTGDLNFLDDEYIQSLFSESDVGRGLLFQDRLAGMLPETGPIGLLERAAARQFLPMNVGYQLQSALSDFDTPIDFTGYMDSVLGNMPTGADIRSTLGNIFNQFDAGGDLSPGLIGFRSDLTDFGNPSELQGARNFAEQLALSTIGMGFGNPFRQSFQNVLGRRFDRAFSGGDSPFSVLQDFVGGGGGFFQ